MPRPTCTCSSSRRSDPRFAGPAYDNRGFCKLIKGELDGAMADIEQAIRLNPKNAMAYANRATAKEVMGDLDGAIADYSRAIKLNPRYVAAYNNRGDVKRP